MKSVSIDRIHPGQNAFPVRKERHIKYSRRRAHRLTIATRCRRFLRDRIGALITPRKLLRARQSFAPRAWKQSIGRISKTRQRFAAKIFETFARATRALSDQLAKLRIARFFPCDLRLNNPFMLATLELNTSPNHLYGSILRHPRNCIDAPLPKCKIELPKPQHVVSVRALGTIGCGSWKTPTRFVRVLGRFEAVEAQNLVHPVGSALLWSIRLRVYKRSR